MSKTPVAEHHEDPCFCELFSDLYKDRTGMRPRGEWSCQDVRRWHDENYDENYVEIKPKYWVPRS